ncbi:MAG TPA: hypothetical protein VGA88_09115 [Burkholderiales bacterium]
MNRATTLRRLAGPMMLAECTEPAPPKARTPTGQRLDRWFQAQLHDRGHHATVH